MRFSLDSAFYANSGLKQKQNTWKFERIKKMSQKLMSNYCKKKSVISESEARSEATENNNNEKKIMLLYR